MEVTSAMQLPPGSVRTRAPRAMLWESLSHMEVTGRASTQKSQLNPGAKGSSPQDISHFQPYESSSLLVKC